MRNTKLAHYLRLGTDGDLAERFARALWLANDDLIGRFS